MSLNHPVVYPKGTAYYSRTRSGVVEADHDVKSHLGEVHASLGEALKEHDAVLAHMERTKLKLFGLDGAIANMRQVIAEAEKEV